MNRFILAGDWQTGSACDGCSVRRPQRIGFCRWLGYKISAEDSGRYSTGGDSQLLGETSTRMGMYKHSTGSQRPNGCSVRCPQRIGFCEWLANKISAEDSGRYSTGGESGASDRRNLSGVGPVFGLRDKSRPDRVLENVIPFRCIAVLAAEQMVVESGLPNRVKLLAGCVNRFPAGSKKLELQSSLQSFDPTAQADFRTRTKGNKEVDVIGHDGVPTNADTEFRSSSAVLYKRFLNGRGSQNRVATKCVECDKENWGIEPLKDRLKPRRLAFGDSQHVRCFSARYSGGASFEIAGHAKRSAEDSGRYSTRFDLRRGGEIGARVNQLNYPIPSQAPSGCSVRCPQRIGFCGWLGHNISAEDSGRYSSLSHQFTGYSARYIDVGETWEIRLNRP
jgi:hypothetical protein